MATVDQTTAGAASNAARAAGQGGIATAGKPVPKNTVILSMPDETLHQPAAGVFIFAGVLILLGIAAIIGQTITTYLAVHARIETSKVYLSMDAHGRINAELPVMLASWAIALGAESGMLYFVFRIKDEWMRKAQGNSNTVGGFVHTAIEVTQQVGLVMIWVGAGFLFNTVGDITYIGAITDDVMILIAYMIFVYSFSTVGLLGGLHLLQASLVSWVKWNAWKDAVRGAGKRSSGSGN